MSGKRKWKLLNWGPFEMSVPENQDFEGETALMNYLTDCYPYWYSRILLFYCYSPESLLVKIARKTTNVTKTVQIMSICVASHLDAATMANQVLLWASWHLAEDRGQQSIDFSFNSSWSRFVKTSFSGTLHRFRFSDRIRNRAHSPLQCNFGTVRYRPKKLWQSKKYFIQNLLVWDRIICS